ncbi:MAG: 4Fe-4S cluster-binding domain-containing protein, partial [Clostridiales bacterium]|nr:4Fe-4S cluster-binding domain-containing protein [Clostridiales bacterium]
MRIHFIKAGDDFVLFQCDALRMYRVSKDTKRIIEGLASEDDIRELRSNPGRIQFQGSHAAAALSSVSPARQRTVGEYLGLTLNVSNMCNMACRYCYAEGGTYHSPKRLMSKETARLAVDFFMRQRGKITDIKFFGGEPLLNVPVI